MSERKDGPRPAVIGTCSLSSQKAADPGEMLADRIRFDWRAEEYLYLVTSLDPTLPVRRFLEQEGLPTGRERRARNVALLDAARDGPPQMPAAC